MAAPASDSSNRAPQTIVFLPGRRHGHAAGPGDVGRQVGHDVVALGRVRTAATSNTSIGAGSAPAARTYAARWGDRAMTLTRCPAATMPSTARRPSTPVPPATRIRTVPAYATLTAATNFDSESLASPKSMVVFGS